MNLSPRFILTAWSSDLLTSSPLINLIPWKILAKYSSTDQFLPFITGFPLKLISSSHPKSPISNILIKSTALEKRLKLRSRNFSIGTPQRTPIDNISFPFKSSLSSIGQYPMERLLILLLPSTKFPSIGIEKFLRNFSIEFQLRISSTRNRFFPKEFGISLRKILHRLR